MSPLDTGIRVWGTAYFIAFYLYSTLLTIVRLNFCAHRLSSQVTRSCVAQYGAFHFDFAVSQANSQQHVMR